VSLENYRARIDDIDTQMLKLLNERATCAKSIGDIKRSTTSVFYVPEREKLILDKLRALNAGPLPDEALKAIYREIISSIRALEKTTTVAFLGPLHTFSHMASKRIFGATAEYHPMPTVPDIFTEVERKRVDYGVVPVETSMAGGVSDTLDRFIVSDVKIINEIMLRITQNLLSNSPLEEIERVYSKEQVFPQCRNWLQANLPHAELIPVSSTAEAARMASVEKGVAAIASKLAADSYQLDIVVPCIEDAAYNYTRFFVIGRQVASPTGNDKTSLLLSARDRPGALYNLLLPFARAGINLTRIESRPSRKKAWEYVFFMDLIGHVDEPQVREALDQVAEHCVELKVFGSYPTGEVED
jgi:chorismate mutase/prephenate dehydratase